jgi:protein phosphatase inhibitor 2
MEDRKGIKWDEEGIQEHDKTRGTRMKITEPKTPYHYYNEDEDPELIEANVQEVMPKLEKLKKKQEFEQKRKNHYNEFEMMKKFKQQLKDSESDEEI